MQLQIHYNFTSLETLCCLSGESGGYHFPPIVVMEGFKMEELGSSWILALALSFRTDN